MKNIYQLITLKNVTKFNIKIFNMTFVNSLLMIFGILLIASCTKEVTTPVSREVTHFDEYHGQKISDPYRWLENFTNDEVKQWVSLQNNFSQQFLKNKFQKSIKQDLELIWTSEFTSIPFRSQKRIFYYFNPGKLQQNKLIVKDCESCNERILIDPNNFSKDGTVSLASVSVSPDSEWIAFAKSDGGSDWRTWQIMNVATGKILDDEIEWSKFSGAEWSPNSKGFYYRKYLEPEGEELLDLNNSPRLMFHSIGTNQKEDQIIIWDKNDPLLSRSIAISDDGQYKILYTTKGTDERNFLSIGRYEDEEFISIVDEFVASYTFIDSEDNYLWFLTDHMAPNGKIVRLDFDNLDLGFEEIIQEAEFSIRSADMINQGFVINYIDNTFSNIKYFSKNGNENGSLSLESSGTISGFSGRKDDHSVFYSFTNFKQPTQIYKLNFLTGFSELFWEENLTNFDSKNYETRMEFYPSKDGTLIPLHITHKKDLQINSNTPILLYGYGGFNISILPRFSKRYLAWMNQGGVFALANLRGGSEYGRSWHEQGMLLNKQNVFDDFSYAAKFLHGKKIGSPKSTVIQGRSNGGLLVGAVMLQNPELFGFAIPQVGVMDMLRFNKFTIGWGWESDYGSPENLDDFENLYSYSPYHNIQRGVCYPPTLITTSDRDDRVVPSHSYKFAARLQSLQSCDNKIMLRVETRSGHGAGIPRDKQIDEIADIYGTALSFIR